MVFPKKIMKDQKKIYLAISVFLILGLVFYFIFQERQTLKIGAGQAKKAPYFVSIPISKFSAIEVPCLDVEIDHNIFSLELDLGFRGYGSLDKQFVNQISSKKFLCVKPMYGVRGKEYPTRLYEIKGMKIGSMLFSKLVLHESHEEFVKDAVFVKYGKSLSPRESGSVGWPLFYHTNLLLDVKNSKIAFADSLSSLKENGYPIASFEKVALKIDRGFVECEATTSQGVVRCVLDTGCTWNMVNVAVQADVRPIEEAMWDTKNRVSYSSFKLGEKEIGPISFHRVPLRLPLQIDMVLGMDFFQDYLVFIDFAEGFIYFMKNV